MTTFFIVSQCYNQGSTWNFSLYAYCWRLSSFIYIAIYILLEGSSIPAVHMLFTIFITPSLSPLFIPHKYMFDRFTGFSLVHSVFFLQGERRGKKEAERPPSPEGGADFRDSVLEQHITPLTLKPKIKQNPLYLDLRTVDMEENQRSKPSWTIEDYDRHSLHGNLASYLQVHSLLTLSTHEVTRLNIMAPTNTGTYKCS